MCLVLGPSDVARIDNALVDNRSILTTKNILSLRKIDEKMAKIGGQESHMAAAYRHYLLEDVSVNDGTSSGNGSEN